MTIENKALYLEAELTDLVINGARSVLETITRCEIADLEKHDPSFAELALRAKRVLLLIHAKVEEKEFKQKLFSNLEEYVSILESIAEGVTSKSNSLLIDCIAHLNEFLEINGKKRT